MNNYELKYDKFFWYFQSLYRMQFIPTCNFIFATYTFLLTKKLISDIPLLLLFSIVNPGLYYPRLWEQS